MRILIVDDDESFRLALRNAFLRRGYDVSLAGSPAEVESAVREATPQYAVVDLRMPGGSGLDVVKALRSLPTAPAIVVLTGYGTIGTAVEAIRLGALNYLNKPCDADEIEAALLGKRPPPPVNDVPSLDRHEWEYLNRILADCNGNISEAARRLGLHRRSLQLRLRKNPPK